MMYLCRYPAAKLDSGTEKDIPVKAISVLFIGLFASIVLASNARADFQMEKIGSHGIVMHWTSGDKIRLIGRCTISNNKVGEVVAGVFDMIPYVSQGIQGKFIRSAMKRYVTLEKGEAYCAVAMLKPDRLIPQPADVSDVVLYVKSWKNKEVVVQDSPSYFCKRIHRTGVCYEVLETDDEGIDGVSACVDFNIDSQQYSASFGIGNTSDDVASTFANEHAAITNTTCAARGLNF